MKCCKCRDSNPRIVGSWGENILPDLLHTPRLVGSNSRFLPRPKHRSTLGLRSKVAPIQRVVEGTGFRGEEGFSLMRFRGASFRLSNPGHCANWDSANFFLGPNCAKKKAQAYSRSGTDWDSQTFCSGKFNFDFEHVKASIEISARLCGVLKRGAIAHSVSTCPKPGEFFFLRDFHYRIISSRRKKNEFCLSTNYVDRGAKIEIQTG